jgi:hypothetical protein
LLNAVPETIPIPATHVPEDPGAPPRPTLRREWLLLVIAIALLVATVVPPLVNLGRYQHRIVDTMSRSLGRQVNMSAVTLRMFPMPALVLSDVVVEEQAGFGAEPALRAPSVIAQIRLASLWRGRLEVSRVELTDASINLVRDREGRWNVGSILLQASHVPNAPTTQRRAGPAPRFPYIEITDSRVNLKQGVEKLPYSLLNANLSMWLAEPEIWQIRLDGQPVRTDVDLGLSDTGILRVEGKLHRATALGHMPLTLHGDWANAPLGQASRLLLGSDRGWRGDLHAAADVSGDLDSLAIRTHIQVANLHREEFTPPEPFAVDATCRAAYSRAARTLSDLTCRWPVGKGQLLLTGSLSAGQALGPVIHRAAPAPNPGLQSTLALTVQQLPASFLVAAAGLARSDFAPEFHLEGALNGMLFYTAHGTDTPLYAGVLEASRLRLEASGLETPLELADARLAAATPAPSGVSTLELTTAPIDLGGTAPVAINAQLTAQGFLLHAAGSASLARLEALGRATHTLPAALAWLAPHGTAEFDLTRTASWLQAASPISAAPDPGPSASRTREPGPETQPGAYSTTAVTNGWLRLKDAQYRPRFLPEPATLPTAQATFLPGEIDWTTPNAIFHGIPLQLAANYPLACTDSPACVTHVRAISATLDADALSAALLGTGANQHLLDQLLRGLASDSSQWPTIEGTLHADTFTLGRLALHRADATLSIANGRATLRSLDAQTLGGTLHTEGIMTIEAGAPAYTLATTLTRITASSAGALFHENWGPGTLTISLKLKLSGLDAEQLATSAQGEFHAEWLRGALGTQTPLARFAAWTADGKIASETLTLTQGQLATGPSAGLLPVSGNITFDRALALHFGSLDPGPNNPESSVTVKGTLAHPGR